MRKIKDNSSEALKNEHISQVINVFHGRQTPEQATLVGYGAIIDSMKLAVPMPDQLAIISEKHRQYRTPEWIVYTPRYMPQDSLYGHLIFALKYEGINLLFFKKLFDFVEKETIVSIVIKEPLSQYSRKIWFLYEWLLQKVLDISDLKEGNYVALIY